MKVAVKKDGHHFYTHINRVVIESIKAEGPQDDTPTSLTETPKGKHAGQFMLTKAWGRSVIQISFRSVKWWVMVMIACLCPFQCLRLWRGKLWSRARSQQSWIIKSTFRTVFTVPRENAQVFAEILKWIQKKYKVCFPQNRDFIDSFVLGNSPEKKGETPKASTLEPTVPSSTCYSKVCHDYTHRRRKINLPSKKKSLWLFLLGVWRPIRWTPSRSSQWI